MGNVIFFSFIAICGFFGGEGLSGSTFEMRKIVETGRRKSFIFGESLKVTRE